MSATAKLFMHGRSQAVRLPKEFRFEGSEVRVSKVGDKVILEPMKKQPVRCRRRGSRVLMNSVGEISCRRVFRTIAGRTRSARVFRRMICLDTNIAIYVMNRRIPSVRLRLAETIAVGDGDRVFR